MRVSKYVLLYFLVLNKLFLSAQDKKETDFAFPVNYDYVLSGNFGEIRPNHFHAGIDIRTYRVGKPLYAPEDGRVSRIKVSSGGYGKALYIKHPNGYKTVYAHMHRFTAEIESYISRLQHEREEFEITVYPDTSLFKFKKGDFIGTAGNSGRSFGPHLHFEIRESLEDVPVNPFLHGQKVLDTREPQINGFIIYDIDKEGSLRDKRKFLLDARRYNRSYPYEIEVSGIAGISVNVKDYMNNTRNTQGPYTLELHLDDSLIFRSVMNKISFYESRYINSYIDYEEHKNKRSAYSKLFIEPGNKLSIYDKKVTSDAGLIKLSDNDKHKLKLTAKDFAGNKRSIYVYIRKNNSRKFRPLDCNNKMFYDKDNFYESPKMRLYAPKGCFYTNFCLSVKTNPSEDGLYSNVYDIGTASTPVHKRMFLSISAEMLPENLRDKALIIRKTYYGYRSAGGKHIKGFFTAKIRRFGTYALTVDTTAPEIQPYRTDTNNPDDKLFFKIEDDLSGIAKYKAYIDGEFVLFAYDAKYDLLTYEIEEKFINNSSHYFKLVVFDKKNNKAVFETDFFK